MIRLVVGWRWAPGGGVTARGGASYFSTTWGYPTLVTRGGGGAALLVVCARRGRRLAFLCPFLVCAHATA